MHVLLDNTTAIQYINKMGGRKPLLNTLTKEMWEWCVAKDIWIIAFHIPGKHNARADALSRQKLSADMEWGLTAEIFSKLMNKFGTCDIDLFASSKNFKLPIYVSFGPDNSAYATDAFSLSWSKMFAYIFPPFSVLGRVLQKLEQDQGEALLIAPIFTTQPWFPRLLHMISGQSCVLPKVSEVLIHPKKDFQHRLTKMVLGAFRISGKPSAVMEYQMTLPKSSSHRGEMEHRNSINPIYRSGLSFVVKDRLIRLNHL